MRTCAASRAQKTFITPKATNFKHWLALPHGFDPLQGDGPLEQREESIICFSRGDPQQEPSTWHQVLNSVIYSTDEAVVHTHTHDSYRFTASVPESKLKHYHKAFLFKYSKPLLFLKALLLKPFHLL